MYDIGFFFEYKNRVIQLPVNPESIEVTYAGNNKTSEIIGLGQINIIRDKKLADITVSSFFPEDSWFSAVRTKGEFEGPQFYLDFFKQIMEDCSPCRFVVTGVEINMLVSIESFAHKNQAGDHEDYYYTLKLREYRPFSLKEIIQYQNAPGTAIKAVVANSKVPQRAPTAVTVGANVKVSGTVCRDSYGNGPGRVLSNYTGRVSHINKKGSHPYHITTPDGSWLGWVKESEVKL